MSTRSEQLRTSLREARRAKALSQDQLAAAARVSRQTISSIETGQYCPSAVLALRLAGVLDTTVEALFWLEDETNAHPSRA
jgi:putative transcriptional regulator